MKEQDLDQFLVDYHPDGSIVEVDAQWLQSQLKNLEHYRKLIIRLNARIACLEVALNVKSIHTPRVRLLV